MNKIVLCIAKMDDYEDVEGIMKQIQQLHVELRPDLYKTSEVTLPYEIFLKAVERNSIIVAKYDQKIVGFVFYVIKHIKDNNHVSRDIIYIDSIGVDQDYRKQGIGHQLLDYIKQLKQQMKLDGIELQVNSKNIHARKMYEKYGFKEKSVTMEL